VGFYLYRRKTSEKTGLDVLGLLLWDMQGPGIFWEKDWGSINTESYSAHTVPIIHGYIELCRRNEIYLKLMQDGAPRHAAGDTRTEL